MKTVASIMIPATVIKFTDVDVFAAELLGNAGAVGLGGLVLVVVLGVMFFKKR